MLLLSLSDIACNRASPFSSKNTGGGACLGPLGDRDDLCFTFRIQTTSPIKANARQALGAENLIFRCLVHNITHFTD
eukprot:m.96611 g.96611  ORF g.96611 m.96611 type:complete len:77 (-) comp13552_c0_seq5:385-615(-)